MLVDLQLPAVL
jgi:hypothetical protein